MTEGAPNRQIKNNGLVGQAESKIQLKGNFYAYMERNIYSCMELGLNFGPKPTPRKK